jgi:hypothetical protein
MRNRALIGDQIHVARLGRLTPLHLLVLVLAACSGDGTDAPRPVVTPPPIVVQPPAPKPFAILDMVRVFTDDDGQVRLAPIHGGLYEPVALRADGPSVTMDGTSVDVSELRSGDVALIRGKRRIDYDGGHPRDVWEWIDSIDAHHFVVGTIESVDATHARLVVLGQPVTVTGETIVFDRLVSEGALADAQPGQMVEVSGFLTAAGEVLATRIDATDSSVFMLRGFVAAADKAANRLRVGSVDVDYGQAAIDWKESPVADPMIGDQVLVFADAGPTDGYLLVSSLTFVPRALNLSVDTEVLLNGMVTRFDSTYDVFDVAGIAVQLDCPGDDCIDIREGLALNAAVQMAGARQGPDVVTAWQATMYFGGLQSLFPSGETIVEGPITAIDTGTGAIEILGFHAQFHAHSRFIDEREAVAGDEITAQDLHVGDVASAAGTYGGTPGLLIAETIKLLPQSDPVIVTHRFGGSAPAILVLGQPVMTHAATAWDRCRNSATDASALFDDEIYVYYLTIGLPALATPPLAADWVSIYDDSCQ